MGTAGKRKRSRTHVRFPPNSSIALRVGKRKGVPQAPRLIAKKPESRLPKGTRIRKYGYTLEESLINIAPPSGTKPERMIFGWLVKHGIPFDFQKPILGGRLPGGAVLDFMIYHKIPAIALRVQSYWHKPLKNQWADDIQANMIIDLGYQLEDVWEHEVNTYDKVNRKMQEILYSRGRLGTSSMVTRGLPHEHCPFCHYPDCVWCP